MQITFSHSHVSLIIKNDFILNVENEGNHVLHNAQGFENCTRTTACDELQWISMAPFQSRVEVGRICREGVLPTRGQNNSGVPPFFAQRSKYKRCPAAFLQILEFSGSGPTWRKSLVKLCFERREA